MFNPNLQFTLEDDRKDMVITHTNYKCPFCGRNQSIVAGWAKDCIYCGKPLNPPKVT